MKVLDLFSGTKGWGVPWEQAGHEVIYVDIRADLNPTMIVDLMKEEPSIIPWKPDIILASPPCQKFSVSRIGWNWNKDNTPKTKEAQEALDLVYRLRYWIDYLSPKFFVIENPIGKLRKLDALIDLELRSVTYCQYGETRMKPTDLWGGFPPSLVLKPKCPQGGSCHTSAPRGSYTGTQGTAWEIMVKVPKALSLSVMEATEKDLASGLTWKDKETLTPAHLTLGL